MESSSKTSSAYASAVATPSTTPPSGSISNAGSDAENQSKLKFASPPVFTSLWGPELVADHILAPNRILLGILKRFIGVSDIASVRFSLPSQLLEPVPNLGEKDSRV